MQSPFLLLRLGSNAEKRYAERLGSFFSGYIVRGNFFETSPGLITGLFLDAHTRNSEHGYIIDPVTYVFGLEPGENSVRSWQKVKEEDASTRLAESLRIAPASINSSWIREIPDPTIRDEGKVNILNIRRSYRALADHTLGSLSSLAGLQAISPEDITEATAAELVEAGAAYQLRAIASRLPDDTVSEVVPPPAMILSPYFLVNSLDWWQAMRHIYASFSDLASTIPKAHVLHISSGFLEENSETITSLVCESDSSTWAIWIDDTIEDSASDGVLAAYSSLVHSIARAGKTIFNLYGGFFSVCLTGCGLAGMCNGPGYGEYKSAEPITTGPVPVKLYIPPLSKRMNVTDSYDLLRRVYGSLTYNQYSESVCPCPICKNGLETSGLAGLIPYYGETKQSRGRDGRIYSMPTAQAIERSRFHFLLQRLSEFRTIARIGVGGVRNILDSKQAAWPGNRYEIAHIIRWLNNLG